MRLVAYTDNVGLGGADLSMMHLLARLDPAIDVTVVGVAAPIVERVASARPAADVCLVPAPRSGRDLRSLAAHAGALRRLAPDVLHANLSSPWSCQYAVAGAALLVRPRIVCVYQLVVPPFTPGQRRAKRLTARAVDAHVGVGERTSREVESVVGLPAGSVLTVHNGVPDEPLPPAPARLDSAPLIGAVGRLEPQKGFDTLLRALVALPDAHLCVVGDGAEREPLERLASELGVAGRVRWEGWVHEPRRRLQTFDVLAVPSRFEGFPLVVLEALLARTAVVAADVGSVGEAVVDGETGLLVPPHDAGALAAALGRALADPVLRSRLGEAGRRRVLDSFTAEHMAHGFERLYDELLSGRR